MDNLTDIGIGVFAVIDLAAGLEHFVLGNSAKGSSDSIQ